MAVAGDRVFVQGARGGSSLVIALNRADGKEVWSKALGTSRIERSGPRTARHAHRRRRSALRAHRERRSRVPEDRRRDRSGSATFSASSAAARLQWLISESPLVDGAACRRFARRAGRRHGEAGQDDRQDGLDVEGAQRSGRLFVDHRRRRAGRAHLHDLHGSGRCGRARRRTAS